MSFLLRLFKNTILRNLEVQVDLEGGELEVIVIFLGKPVWSKVWRLTDSLATREHKVAGRYKIKS